MVVLVAPPTRFVAVTPSDNTDLSSIATRGLYIGTTGTVVVKGLDGVQATFVSVPAATVLHGNFSRVMTATGASNIVALGG